MNLFNWFKKDTAHEPVLERADRAIEIADDVIKEMRIKKHRLINDPVEALIIDLRRHRRNIPFLTTVYEAVQEAKPYPH